MFVSFAPFALCVDCKMNGQHNYQATIRWTGDKGTGTSGYAAYERSHVIIIENKTEIQGSADPTFRGDTSKHNPEDLLLASLSSCHMLSYLYLCAKAGVVVVDYVDTATGNMLVMPNGSGKFTEVMLNPVVTVTDNSMIENANELHGKAHELCFIANSVNFPVGHKPICILK